MKCPKCREGEVKENINFRKGWLGSFKKIVIYYCPLCQFENKKEFQLTKEDVDIETKNRINRDKETKVIYESK